MTDTTVEDPAAIERDIRRTQDDMSRTVDKIGDQLSVKNIFNALLDKADENNVDARMLLDGARRNPIALGLIAAGAIWLVSDKDSKFPSVGSGGSEPEPTGFDDQDVHHRDYVSHMTACEMREGEEASAYQRRRDIARSNFFMVERGQDEDDHGFRQRLDSISDKFRETRRAWADSAGQAQTSAKQTARQAASKTQDLYSANPLVGGILAAAVGAAFGSTLPISRQEQDKLGALGDKARDLVDEQKEIVGAQLGEKKDELLEKVDQKLQQSDANSGASSPESGGGDTNEQERPFIIGDQLR